MHPFSRSTAIRILSILVLILFISTNAEALNLNIKNVTVNVGRDGVVIKISYDVDPLKKLQILLFGAMPIRDEFASLTDSKAEFLKVGVDEAIFKIYFEDDNGTKYFSGIELGKNVNICINVSGTTFLLENTTKIPAFYYS